MQDGAAYTESIIVLEPEDLIVVYSDGVTDECLAAARTQLDPNSPVTAPAVSVRQFQTDLQPERRRGVTTAHGAVAQLGEHLLCKQEVTGSIPVGSTVVTCCRLSA